MGVGGAGRLWSEISTRDRRTSSPTLGLGVWSKSGTVSARRTSAWSIREPTTAVATTPRPSDPEATAAPRERGERGKVAEPFSEHVTRDGHRVCWLHPATSALLIPILGIVACAAVEVHGEPRRRRGPAAGGTGGRCVREACLGGGKLPPGHGTLVVLPGACSKMGPSMLRQRDRACAEPRSMRAKVPGKGGES